ncbi:hypothetical protein Trydic_g10866 [Trypoxylus dichotomus]
MPPYGPLPFPIVTFLYLRSRRSILVLAVTYDRPSHSRTSTGHGRDDPRLDSITNELPGLWRPYLAAFNYRFDRLRRTDPAARARVPVAASG